MTCVPLYTAGQQINAWTLLGRSAAPDKRWRVRCACGYERLAAPIMLGKACHKCSARARVQPRLCVRCGTTDPRRFKKASECEACERRRIRNGLCPLCPRTLHAGKGGTFCECGWRSPEQRAHEERVRPARTSEPERRLARTIHAFHGAHVAPTVNLLSVTLGWHPRAVRRLAKRARLCRLVADLRPAGRVPKRALRARGRARRKLYWAKRDPGVPGPRYVALGDRWLAGEDVKDLAFQAGVKVPTLRAAFSRLGIRKGV